ncbi:unnamed protein product [Didymodactylos carnosus]|nr:unnamed protein product [Didymodactylos carnosus]
MITMSSESNSDVEGSDNEETNSGDDNMEIEDVQNELDDDEFDGDGPISDDWSIGVIVDDKCGLTDQTTIIQLLQKCRTYVNKIKNSMIISSYIDNERKKMKVKRKLIVDVISRWNSTYYMIDGFLKLKPIITKFYGDIHILKLKQKHANKLAAVELTSNE